MRKSYMAIFAMLGIFGCAGSQQPQPVGFTSTNGQVTSEPGNWQCETGPNSGPPVCAEVRKLNTCKQLTYPWDTVTRGPDAAITACTDFIQLHPDWVVGYAQRANAYFGKNEFDLALEDYERVLQLQPDNRFTYSEIGSLYYKQGKYDLAIDSFNKWVDETRRVFALRPTNALPYESALSKRADAYAANHQFKLAIADFNQEIDLGDPHAIPAVLAARGGAYAANKQYDLALKDYLQALRRDRNNDDAKTGLDHLSSMYPAARPFASSIQLPADVTCILSQVGGVFTSNGMDPIVRMTCGIAGKPAKDIVLTSGHLSSDGTLSSEDFGDFHIAGFPGADLRSTLQSGAPVANNADGTISISMIKGYLPGLRIFLNQAAVPGAGN